jgi:hypothetical protein
MSDEPYSAERGDAWVSADGAPSSFAEFDSETNDGTRKGHLRSKPRTAACDLPPKSGVRPMRHRAHRCSRSVVR